jgi:hypothetical protein
MIFTCWSEKTVSWFRSRLIVCVSLLACCGALVSCGSRDEILQDGVFTRTELSILENFRASKGPSRSATRKEIGAILQNARARLPASARRRMNREALLTVLGTPDQTEETEDKARLIYRTTRRGGEQEYLVVVLVKGVFVITEPMWSVE